MRMVTDRTGGYREQILRRTLASYITEVPDVLAGLPPYRNERHVLRAFQAYVEANAGTLSAAAQATVAAVLAKAASGGCHLMPLYGLHANSPGDWTLNTLVRAVHVLKNVLGLIDGPVVLFNIAGRYNTVHEANNLCTPLLADHGHTAAQITGAADGIFVIKSPGMLTPLFQQMPANATLPMLLEGANTANLCLQLGLPYLALSDNPSIPTLDVEGARGHVTLRRLANSEQGGGGDDHFLWGAHRATNEQVERVATAIINIVDDNGVLRRYFQRLHQLVRGRANNQIAIALASLERRIQARGPALVVPPAPAQPIRFVFGRQEPAQPPPGPPKIFKCPRCRSFASLGPGDCWKCGATLAPE